MLQHVVRTLTTGL